MPNPLKKIVVGFITQRVLKRALPRLIPGGLALIVVAEVAQHAVKRFVNKDKPKARVSKKSIKKS